MAAHWYRELLKYDKEKIISDLGGGDAGKKRLEKLQLASIVKLVPAKSSDSDEVLPEDLEQVVDGNEKMVSFVYVGVVMLDDYVIYCYPKYISSNNAPGFIEKFATVMASVKRYRKHKEQNVAIAKAGSDRNVSKLSVIMELLQHYYRNGLYIKSVKQQEINGDGEINWGRTINETDAILLRKKPFYPDMFTEVAEWNEGDYFHRLHRFVISDCFRTLKQDRLMDVLGVHGFLSSDIKDRHVFGKDKVIVQKLQRELKTQFVTWKKEVLNLIISYIKLTGSSKKSRGLVFYGTKAMNMVWEDACKQVFNDMLGYKIKSDKMAFLAPKEQRCAYCKQLMEHRTELLEEKAAKKLRSQLENPILQDVIDHPVWMKNDKGHISDSLIPDTIVITGEGDDWEFCVYDAKYYNIKLDDDMVSGKPDIESVTKQYLYMMAYKDFMEYFNIKKKRNVFLFPSEDGNKRLGTVQLPFLNAFNEASIEVIKLDADKMLSMYVAGNKHIGLDEVINV